MRCRECGYAKKFAEGCALCLLYGMIIREDHICRGKGRERREDERYDPVGEGEAGLQEDGGGAAGEVPGVL